MTTIRNSKTDRLSGSSSQKNPSDTTKQNYTESTWSNDHGSISFGHIHKPGDVTAAVLLNTPDGRHQFSMDKDGQRKGWTSSTSPGNFQLECGSDNEVANDSLIMEAKNGNIIIKASNGKIRMEADDIEFVARGDNAQGNIQMTATETIKLDCKKFLVTAKSKYKIVTPGTGEVIANGVLKMYGSIIRGVSDGCSIKDAKTGGQRYQQQQQGG
jgi:hypothetical protein